MQLCSYSIKVYTQIAIHSVARPHTHTQGVTLYIIILFIHTLLENKPIYIHSVHYQVCTRNHISRLAISKDIKHANSLHCQIEVSRSSYCTCLCLEYVQ